MEKQQPEELIHKYLGGKATLDEKVKLESWYLTHSGSKKDALPEIDYPIVGQEMWSLIEKQLQRRNKRRHLWARISIAAAILVIVSGLYFYHKTSRIKEPQLVNVETEISPGKNIATLTLANGKMIKLSDTKTGIVIDGDSLTYNDGSNIAGTNIAHKNPVSAEAERMVASTPRGGQYQFVLADGTKVWLNADSKLEFPSDFSSAKERIVTLKGEAYFEVAKHNNSAGRVPFKVVTDQQVIEVLGTHFNVNSYRDEVGVKTTLLEGSIKITAAQQPKNQVVLKPNEQAFLTEQGTITVKNVEVEDAIAWKNGDFIFDNDDLESIMRKIARWYDVDIYYPEMPKKNMRFGGVVSRSKKISSVLNIMQSTGQVKFKVQGRQITVIQN